MIRMAVRPLLMAGLVMMAMLAGSAPAAAQAPRQEADPFATVLFPPELIMQHARAIRLNDEQRDAITRLIGQTQGRVLGLQLEMVEQVATLKATLARSRVDQDQALDQLNRVLDTEKSIKKAHLEMLVRIKNVLRTEQQTELARLRDAAAERKDPEPQEKS